MFGAIMHRKEALDVWLHTNGAFASMGAALSCRIGLVAQWFEPDFLRGTVAAKLKQV
jgi:hypothetical protein